MIRDVESSFADHVWLEEAAATDQDSGYDKNPDVKTDVIFSLNYDSIVWQDTMQFDVD